MSSHKEYGLRSWVTED